MFTTSSILVYRGVASKFQSLARFLQVVVDSKWPLRRNDFAVDFNFKLAKQFQTSHAARRVDA